MEEDRKRLNEALADAVCALYRVIKYADAVGPCAEQSRGRQALEMLGVLYEEPTAEEVAQDA